MTDHNINFTVIINPIHGEFAGNSDGIIQMINNQLPGYFNFQYGIIINQFTNIDYVDSLLHDLNFRRPYALMQVG